MATGTPVSGNTEKYKVQWNYMVNNVWFDGGTEEPTYDNSLYSFPSNATTIKVTVTPVAKTRQVGDNQVPYWNGEPTTTYMVIENLPPARPGTPNVEIDKYKLTAKVENIEDARCETLEFEVVKDDTVFTSGQATVSTARASFTCNIDPGGKYRVRCRSINYVGGSPLYSEWSLYSNEVGSIPGAPTNVKVNVESEKAVKVSWDVISTATGYTVEYTTNKLYFDSSSEVSSITVEANYAMITGIEKGYEYYFRVKANNKVGDSGWSEIVYKIIGTKPEPPTTWSLTSTAIIGDPVTLYWVHNSEDASKQHEAQIELTINGEAEIITLDTSSEEVEDTENKTYSYELDLSKYTEGAEILWRVRTRGVSFEYSDWSVKRTINTYAPPTSTLTCETILTQFPYPINITVGPDTQRPISYHISITAENTYRTLDLTGKPVYVNAGEEVYSKIFLHSLNNLLVNVMPEDIILENNQSYKITVTICMNSSLTTSASKIFVVSWSDERYSPDASVFVDNKTLCAYINPYCLNDEYNLIEDVVLAVYRREFDGTFTEITTNIENYGSVAITDPHPSLDYARYRIVARNRNTNVIGFTDIPAVPVGVSGVVIQWAEEWRTSDQTEAAPTELPVLTGSMVRLPFNVDKNETYAKDTSLVNYIGRKSPVSYYGTQQGVSDSWSMVIDKEDTDTLFALRRLAVWPGDVYIRESNGKGYNASVNISFGINHNTLTIPVNIDVTRVEGGY